MKTYQLGGFHILEYEELASTNTTAAELPKVQIPDKSVVLTYKQTGGRGQVGNKWESKPGKNISMTVVLRPEKLEAARQFAVSMVIALGCRDFIGKHVRNCRVKWPNDVYVGDRKIAGILIEHNVSGRYVGSSICGIGLNVNQEHFLSDAPNPVSLCQLLGQELELEKALEDLLVCIGQRYSRIEDYEGLEQDYLSRMYRKEGIHNWEDEAGAFRAGIVGVDEYGRLVLKDERGEVRVYGFKEVKFC